MMKNWNNIRNDTVYMLFAIYFFVFLLLTCHVINAILRIIDKHS